YQRVVVSVHEHPDTQHKRGQRPRYAHRRVHIDPPGARSKNEAYHVRACGGRRPGVLRGRQAANLDSGHDPTALAAAAARGTPARPATAWSGSGLVTSDSPTRIAWTPAAARRSTSARDWMPDSLTTTGPGGMRPASSRVTS